MSAGYSPNTSKNSLNCQWQIWWVWSRPIAFQVCLPFTSALLWASYQMDMCDKSAGFRKHSTWQSRLQEKWQRHQNGRTASRPRRRPAAEAPNVKKLSGRLQRRGCEAACRSGPARRDGSAAASACSKLPTLTHGALVTEQLVTFAV